MERSLIGMVIGSLLLAGLVPVARAAGPVATAQVVVGNHEKHTEFPTGMTEELVPPGWDLVSYDDFDNNGEKKLPERVMERGAGKIGAALGSAVGTAAGYAFFGFPGALITGGIGAVLGEVFFEVIISNVLRAATGGPLMPRMILPLIPVK